MLSPKELEVLIEGHPILLGIGSTNEGWATRL
jgi:hypothetical protein